MASGRVELPRPSGHRLLRPTRLPFRHEASFVNGRVSGQWSVAQLQLWDFVAATAKRRGGIMRRRRVPCKRRVRGLLGLTGALTGAQARASGGAGSERAQCRCRDCGRWAWRMRRGAGGAANRPHGHFDRGDRLDRRASSLLRLCRPTNIHGSSDSGRRPHIGGCVKRFAHFYRRHYPLTAEARSNERFNPGNGAVSALCHEPRAALAALTDLLAPYASSGRLLTLLDHEPIGAASARRSGASRHGARSTGRWSSGRCMRRTFLMPPSWAIFCRWRASNS